VNAGSSIWVADVYRLDGEDVDAAIDLVYARMHELFAAKDWATADAIIDSIDVTRLADTATVLSFLTISVPVAASLSARPRYYTRARACLLARLGEEETADVLSGLESPVIEGTMKGIVDDLMGYR